MGTLLKHNVEFLKSKYSLVNYVETGTGTGECLEYALRFSFKGCYSVEIYDEIFQKAKDKGLKTALGGAISPEAVPFIEKIASKNLIDKFETRKLVYHKKAIDNIVEGLTLGVKFELLWLKSKRRYYHRVRDEDEKRIEMLEKRVKNL